MNKSNLELFKILDNRISKMIQENKKALLSNKEQQLKFSDELLEMYTRRQFIRPSIPASIFLT